MSDHEKLVENIASKVRQYFHRSEPFRIYHGSTNSTRLTACQRDNKVDISALSRVLMVDPVSKTASVEPNVSMDRLVESTLEHGLIPSVVMEFPGITAGGGFAGTGGESSSFKYGYFSNTVKSIEIILGNGDIVIASPNRNSDLFHGASGAVGSLGITTLLDIQLIPAKKYVEVTYHKVKSVSEAISKTKTETLNHEIDYVDGMMFSQHHGVIVTGRLTDVVSEDINIQAFSNPSDPWYYLHVKDKTAGDIELFKELIPLSEYLFRYDRGGFWVGTSAFTYFNFPFNRYTRWFLDDFLHTRMLYRALHASQQSRNYVIQDLALPYEKVQEFVEFTAQSLGIWPLWLCPLRQTQLPTFHPQSAETDCNGRTPVPMLNVGLWGFGPSRFEKYIAKNLELEKKLRDLNGRKWLYAQTYYDEDEFWQIYGRQWYDQLRKKYHAKSLPSVWEKVKVDPSAERESANASWITRALQIWPLGGIWGILKAIESGDYHIARKSSWRTKRI